MPYQNASLMKKSALAISFFATIVQYYDYAIFGMSAAALTKAYMPKLSSGHEMLGFFAIISGATLMRPIGSLVFGWIGDTKGKATTLKASVLAAAIAMLLLGIAPEQQSIISASILVIARIIFMMSMAGEGDGVRLYVAETIGVKREFFGNGIVTFSSQIGVLIASFAWWLSIQSNMPEYLWRANFIIGFLCGIVVFLFRKYFVSEIHKTDIGTTTPKISIPLFILAVVTSGCIGGIYHFQIIFFGAFMTKMVGNMSQEVAATLNIMSVLLYAASALFSGYLGDRYGPKKQILISLMLTICSGIIICIYTHNLISLFITALIPFYSVPLQIILKRKMPSKIMLRAFSLSHSMGSMIFSASVPFIASVIWHSTHKIWAPLLYVVFVGVVLLVCCALLFKRPIKNYPSYSESATPEISPTSSTFSGSTPSPPLLPNATAADSAPSSQESLSLLLS